VYSTKKLPEGLARILHLVPCRFRVHLRLIVENLSKIKPKLRTQGRVTGNFGRNKVEGKRQSLELSKSTLSKENLRIPRRKDVYSRLQEAYALTTDPRMKEFLRLELRKAKAQRIQPRERQRVPISDFWEEVKRVR
jgi:hypothetical protein